MPVELIIGPSIQSMSRTAAERALIANPALPKDAEYVIEQHAGHWIAAYTVQGGPPFGGAPADSDEETAGPKSEGPDDTVPEEGGEEPKLPGEGASDEGGPPKEKGEGHEHKEQGELAHVMKLLDAIAGALGVSLDQDPGLIPGADAAIAPPGPPAPHAGPPHPPAPAGPPGGPPGLGGPNEHVIHEKAGPPPIPTFAATEDHPWAHVIGKVKHFRVAEEIGADTDLTAVEQELQAISKAGGFQILRAREERDEDGSRRFAAIIATPPVQ